MCSVYNFECHGFVVVVVARPSCNSRIALHVCVVFIILNVMVLLLLLLLLLHVRPVTVGPHYMYV